LIFCSLDSILVEKMESVGRNEMTSDQETAEIQAVVERYLPALQELPPAQLQLDVGTLAVQAPVASGQVEAEALSPADLMEGARTVLVQVAKVICPVKSDIGDAITSANVTTVVKYILPALGFVAGAVPGAAIAVAVFVLKLGLDDFCMKYGSK
jgi:hypothetical protein